LSVTMLIVGPGSIVAGSSRSEKTLAPAALGDRSARTLRQHETFRV